MPPPSPELGTLRGLRRAQTVAAARALVAREGLPALTIGALEKRLQFTRGVITYHFRDKDDLVDAVLESAVAEIDAATIASVQASLSFAEKLEAVLRSKVRGFLDHPEATQILLNFWSRILHDPRARRVNAALYARYRRQSARLIEEGRASGAFAAGAPTGEMAALLVGTVIGIVTQAVFEPGATDPEACVKEAARTILARLAPGARNVPSPPDRPSSPPRRRPRGAPRPRA